MKRRTFVKTVLGALASIPIGKSIFGYAEKENKVYTWTSGPHYFPPRYRFNGVTKQYERADDHRKTPINKPKINPAWINAPYETMTWHSFDPFTEPNRKAPQKEQG